MTWYEPDPADWTAIVERARTWRALNLATELTGLPEAAWAVKQLSPSLLRRWLIGRFANARLLIEMRDLSKSKWR